MKEKNWVIDFSVGENFVAPVKQVKDTASFNFRHETKPFLLSESGAKIRQESKRGTLDLCGNHIMSARKWDRVNPRSLQVTIKRGHAPPS